MFLLQCLTLMLAGYRIALGFGAVSVFGSFVIHCAVYQIQKPRIAAAAVKKATHLEVVRYIYCFAIVLTCFIDESRIIKKAHGGRVFTYCPLTLVAALIANLFVELLGGWLDF